MSKHTLTWYLNQSQVHKDSLDPLLPYELALICERNKNAHLFLNCPNKWTFNPLQKTSLKYNTQEKLLVSLFLMKHKKMYIDLTFILGLIVGVYAKVNSLEVKKIIKDLVKSTFNKGQNSPQKLIKYSPLVNVEASLINKYIEVINGIISEHPDAIDIFDIPEKPRGIKKLPEIKKKSSPELKKKSSNDSGSPELYRQNIIYEGSPSLLVVKSKSHSIKKLN
jgi:hypothetical protein